MSQHALMTDDAVARYLDRVSYTGPTEATLDVLGALVAAHNRAIPFENLDPLMGVPVADLRPEALIDKLVLRRRGGYCFEQNGVMAYVLSHLGFGVDVCGGRVVWMTPGRDAPLTHRLTLSPKPFVAPRPPRSRLPPLLSPRGAVVPPSRIAYRTSSPAIRSAGSTSFPRTGPTTSARSRR